MGPCSECLVNSTCMEPCEKLSKYLEENKMIRRILLHYQKKVTYQTYHSHGIPGHSHTGPQGNGYASAVAGIDLMKLFGGNE